MYNNHAMNNLVQKKIRNTTVAETLVNTLVNLDVDSVFGYPGASVLSIYNELSYTNKITHYLVRHEQAAIHAAEGYARTSGKVGVVLVTSGPGFTNTITGIANAYTDSTPLVVLAGDVPSTNRHGKVFQHVDIVSMTRSCAKKVYSVSKNDDIKQVLEEAFNIANTGIKGPVVIALPRDILESEYKNKVTNIVENDIKTKNYSQAIEKLNKLLSEAKKPLILVGGGAINASEDITKLVEQYNLPLVSTLMGIGIYPSDSENYMGMIGINGSHSANAVLNNCDLLISFGAAFSDRSTCKKAKLGTNAKIVSVNLNLISEDFELQIKADVKEFLQQYISIHNTPSPLPLSHKGRGDSTSYTENTCSHTSLENLQGNLNYSDWLKQVKSIKEEFIAEDNSVNCLHSSYVLATLSEYTRKYEPIVVTDVGQHQMLTAQFYNFNKPRKFITSGGLGTMGFGLPAAIGAHIANPDNFVLNITGDGSFQMNLQELATCREHNIPVKIIIMNNGYLGMVRQMQEKIYNNRYQVEMTNPDFVKIAEAYDLFAIRVTDKNELIPAINKAIEHKGTAIVDIMIDSFEEI